MDNFVVASGWIMRRRYDNAEQTPKKDRMDYLEYRTDLAYHLIHNQTPEEDIDEVDILPLPVPSKKHVNIPLDIQRKTAAKHMPMIPDNKDHRCRFPGCDSKKARMQCSTCKGMYGSEEVKHIHCGRPHMGTADLRA
ncbi:hypothetical protein J6590_092476 [Homalodisca vitripennis]|nr:hypothetical protein J6590_092476 [Homalodisca vitripennis]